MLEITNKTRRKLSKQELVLFGEIAERVLGKDYELSLVICTDKTSKHNTLAYPLGESDGEILLNPSRKGKYSLPYLFLHSCLHLSGLDHGKKMDSLELKLARQIHRGLGTDL
ncbi:MAG TPA: hypothetical protein VJB98_04015 [Candidatus Paceibacterota bacterium]